MTYTYKKVAIDPKIGKEVSVIRSDGWCIPFDEDPEELTCVLTGQKAKHEVIFARPY